MFAEDSQNIGGIGFSLPSELKDKSPNHDLLLFANVFTAQNDTNGIPYLSSRQPLVWLDLILQRKWIDPQIWANYALCTSPIEREKRKKVVPTPLIQHYGESAIVYKYSIDSYDFAIVDVGERLSFLVRIPSNTVSSIDARITLDHVSNIFNVNPEFINTLRSNLVENAGTYFIMIDDKKYEHGMQVNANIYSKVVYGLFSAKFLFLSFDGLTRKFISRSGMHTIRKDSREKARFQEQKSVIKGVLSQQSTNEMPGMSR